jgi:hypothetical protein
MENDSQITSPITVIINEVTNWLEKVELKARPTSVKLELTKDFCPTEGVLTHKFVIAAQQKFDRVDGQEAAETPAKAAD